MPPPTPGLELLDFSGALLPPADGGELWRLAIRSGRFRLHQAVANELGARFSLSLQLQRDGIHVRGSAGILSWDCLVTVAVLPEGTLRVEVTRPRAAGFLPVPAELIAGRLDRLAGRPGIRRAGPLALELDMATALATVGVQLEGRVREANVAPGVYELVIEPAETDAPADE